MGSTNSDSPWQPTKNDLPEDNLQHLGISFAEIEQNPVFLIITKREKEKAAGRTLRTLLLFGVMVLGAFTPLLAAYPIVFLLAVFRFPMLLFTGPFRCVSAVGISDSLTREDIGLLLDTPLTPEDYAIGTLGAILSRRNVDWTKLTYRLLGFASIMASVVCISGFDGWSGSGLLSLLGSLFAVMFTWFCAAGIVSAQNTPECAIADLARRMRNRLGIPKFIEETVEERRNFNAVPIVTYVLAAFVGLVLSDVIGSYFDLIEYLDSGGELVFYIALHSLLFGFLAGYLRVQPARKFGGLKWARFLKSYELHLESMR